MLRAFRKQTATLPSLGTRRTMLTPVVPNLFQAMPGLRCASNLPQAPHREYEVVPPKSPSMWHELKPVSLALVNSCSNLCGLFSAAVHDHLTMRAFAVCQALGVAAFNFLMPKPLKAHQWAAGSWGSAFAVLHMVNMSILLLGYVHPSFTEEEEVIYCEAFKPFGVTPRQFGNLLQADATYRDLGPREVLWENGSPVEEVVYVVRGSCESRHPETNALRVEYDDGVFIGSLEPEVWQETYSKRPVQPVRQDSMMDQLLFQSGRQKRSRDIRAMLEDMEEKMGSRTRLQEGETWQNRIVAGPMGCRVLCWPLPLFAFVVSQDDELLVAMERIDEMGLTCQLCAGARRMAVEGYQELLESAIWDGRISPEERVALARYRARYAIPEADHMELLQELGWSLEDFEAGTRRTWFRSRKRTAQPTR